MRTKGKDNAGYHCSTVSSGVHRLQMMSDIMPLEMTCIRTQTG